MIFLGCKQWFVGRQAEGKDKKKEEIKR